MVRVKPDPTKYGEIENAVIRRQDHYENHMRGVNVLTGQAFCSRRDALDVTKER